MKFAGWFAIVMGGAMACQWAAFLATGNVPELQTEPIRIAFHLVGELLTAALLVVSGMGLLTRRSWSRSVFFFSSGMLVYTAVVSPGYFAQKGQHGFLVMFGLILMGSAAAVISVVRSAGPSLRNTKSS